MKKVGLFFIFCFTLFAQQQPEIADKQFMLGCSNVGATEVVTHYIETDSEVWQYSSGSFVTGGVNSNSLQTTGNANFASFDWPGFNFNWLYGSPYWSLGFYKVTNSKQTDKYFYLDARDSDFGSVEYLPDFYIVFNNSLGAYSVRGGSEISQGEIVRIWDIHDESPNTSDLQNYWSNALVLLEDRTNPRIVWGPHPSFAATSYKIYRRISSTPVFNPELGASLIATVSSSTYEYTDDDISVNGSDYIYYFVKGYNGSYSSRTNIEYIRGGIFKSNSETESDIKAPVAYSLSQNYPNPFNPSTNISFSIPEKSFVTLRIYDTLGKEVASLFSDVLESGEYTKEWNASEFPTGIYFCRLVSNDKVLIKKMLLIK